MGVYINMEMPTNRDPATGRFLNGHNRYEFLNDPTTAEWKLIEEQNGETWKDVPGFEGRYKISNHGRIRNRNGIVKQQQKRNGYLSVGLRDGSGRKHYSVHRLVAELFVENDRPDIFNQVNHKDENKENNRADNLEWCDGMYNTHYGTAIERMRKRRCGHAPTIIPADDTKLSATIKCGGAVTCAVAYSEEVYGKHVDTAGNLHWTGTHSGEHIVRAEEGET